MGQIKKSLPYLLFDISVILGKNEETQLKKTRSFRHFKLSYTKSFAESVFSILVYEWEKAMAPHSSTLAWKIPWMEEPGRLWFMGSLRVGHD